MSQLLQYIQEGEHQKQDFKFCIEDQKKIARTLVAFANTDGGRLLIGVKDNGKIAGCNPEEEFHMIEGAAELYTQPKVEIETIVHQEGFRLVLEVKVKKGNRKHFQAPDENNKLKLYTRWEDHTLLVNKILQKVWHHQEVKTSRPEKLGEEELTILRSMSEQSLSLSQLYKKSSLPMRRVDQILPLFICWGLVEMEMNPLQTRYKLV